tara:strand:- start:221 stop:505 length:285 start_codon:yes stop_codon:yes gene_type:complete
MSVLTILQEKFEKLNKEIEEEGNKLDQYIKEKTAIDKEIIALSQKINQLNEGIKESTNRKSILERTEIELKKSYNNIIDTATNLIDTLNSQLPN